uniref:DNA-directed DNA polymerase n=1 Tax=Caenorhabditis tropicalis TaxID=1561998 RepID=A0A1I7T0H7_9PELO
MQPIAYLPQPFQEKRERERKKSDTYLIVKRCDREAVQKIIETPIDKMIKNRDTERTSLSRFILEGICTGLTTTQKQIHQLCSLLLFNHENTNHCDHSIEMLLRNSFISLEDDEFSPTQLGRAAIASSLPPEASLAIFEDLNSASRAIALDTELHMLYLVTPINVTVWQECDWHHLFSLFSKLPPDQKRIAKLVGASEKFILDQLQGKRNDKLLQIHIRFFSALALFDLINEMSIYEVSNKYRIPRGCLQTLQSQSATYAAMIVAFCLRLGWTYFKALLDGFAMRLLFGIRSELSELVTIEGIDGQRARILHERGITCLSHLSTCDSSRLAHMLTLAVPYSRSNSNDGLGEWLFGEPRMKVIEAARLLKERARMTLMRRVQELGICVELPKQEEEKEEKEKEEEIQESCDSGLPDSCSDMEFVNEENVKSVDEMTRSVSELSLTDTISEDDFFNQNPKVDDEIVEDTVIECLETSLLKMKASKDKVFLRRLSQTFSPAARRRSILNNGSFLEDSFDKPVPGSIPISSFKTPNRENEDPKTSTPYYEDSFDHPVPGSVPIGFSKRKSVFSSANKMDSFNSNVSENNSFDVFATPPTRESRIIGKHPRITDIQSDSSFISSPLSKQPKLNSIPKFRFEDVCYDENALRRFTKSSISLSTCSISVIDSGVAISTDTTTTFIPLLDNFEGIPNPNSNFFNSISKCVISLETRLEFLKLLFESSEIYIMTMRNAFKLFDKFGIKISHVKVVRLAAHLNHLIDCEAEDQEDVFPMLLKKFGDPETQIAYSLSSDPFKSTVEAFSLKRIFEQLRISPSNITSDESFKLEMSSCQSVLRIFYNGVSFDRISCVRSIETTRRRIEKLEEEIWRLAHGKFNIESSNEVSNVIFHRLGLIYPETSGCKLKQRHLPTNKLILEQMIGQHKIVEKILEYRHIQHSLTQCLLPLSKYNERIHCWMEMCTATGRILTSSPNLQNVPKKVSSDGASARDLFTASPGSLLIGADYKQLELRVLAHLSNDSKLVELIKEDRDLFGELSSEWGFSRDVVKQLCYGLIYGMGPKTLAELTKMKVEEAEKLLNSFFSMFPGVRSYIIGIKEKVAREEYVETILGRRKLIRVGITGEEKARMERVAVNYTVQGTASEIFKTAIVDVESKIKIYGASIVLTIHDEILVDCPKKYSSIVSDLIRNSMQSSLSHLLRVPIKISLKTGQSWAELK